MKKFKAQRCTLLQRFNRGWDLAHLLINFNTDIKIILLFIKKKYFQALYHMAGTR